MDFLIKNPLIRNLLVIALGGVLIAYPQLGPKIVIMVIGALLAIPALLAIIGYISAKKQSTPLPDYILVESVGALILGLLMLLIPSLFSTIITMTLGIILFLAGLLQILSLARAGHAMAIPAVMYIVPVLIVIAGVITFFNPFETINAVMIIFGISTIVFGITEIIRSYKYRA